MIKAVIFDVDGVLVDNTDLLIAAYQEAAVACGKKRPSRQAVKQVMGMTGPDMVRRLIGSDPNYRRIQRRIWNRYEPKMKIAAGLEPMLKKLKVKIAVVTSRRRPSFDRSLGKYRKYFSVIITPNATRRHKPSPQPLLLACRRLGLKPPETVYIGDAIVDAITARRAKTRFIGMLSGSATKTRFQRSGIKYFIRSLAELPAVLKKVN